MSSNLVSQQLAVLNGDMGQLEPAYVNVDSSVLDARMGMMGPVSVDSATQRFAISNRPMQLVDRVSCISGSQNVISSDRHLGNMEPSSESVFIRKPLPTNGEGNASLNVRSQKLYPSKRKAVGEPSFSDSGLQQFLMPNKQVARMGALLSSPGLLHPPAVNKKSVHVQSMSSASASQNKPGPHKKMARNESTLNKSGTQRVQTPKGHNGQIEMSRKIQESSEAVRSKMRESLASALALVYENQDKNSKKVESSPQNVDVSPSRILESTKFSEANSFLVYASGVPESILKGIHYPHKINDGQTAFAEASHEGATNSLNTWKINGFSSILPDADVSFADSLFVKDELLQGNDLSWAWDMDIEGVEQKEVQGAKQVDVDKQMLRSAENPNFRCEAKEGQAAKIVDIEGDGGEKSLQSPEKLSAEIEMELFKYFGGVNKKYKEKGRSLMFNLKDRNNPELRERVMSGDISPEKLCSMTAEELASKELSEWRTAKAEELAQMIVLPNTDGDRRRLVKKTHKGEYQVEEIGQDDSVSVEVSMGTTTFTQLLPKSKQPGVRSSSEKGQIKNLKNVEHDKCSLDNQDSSYSLTIPADGTDLMQGLIGDELKDADFLPSIVSLDEFMESLNSEPPFDNLAADAGQTKSPPVKVQSETGDKLVASNSVSRDTSNTKPGSRTHIDTKIPKFELEVESIDGTVEQKQLSPDKTSTTDRVWEGELQLQISSSVKVTGLFRSGEKTATKDWASSLEIKGRVRIDAFEKFLQQLPMSRSRAVMVVHFVLKPGSSEVDQASLREVIDSYIADERLGFAEPATTTELYLTPPHPKILEMLGKHLAKEQTEIIRSIDNGLIGVVVWRRAHINSTVSPKHGTSKNQQHLTSSRREKKDTNVNLNTMPSKTHIPYSEPPSITTVASHTDASGDDDIPPGFGPGVDWDDDDLPEFNFSGNSTSSAPNRVPSKPVKLNTLNPDHLRQLIQKYGQTGHSENSPRALHGKRDGGGEVRRKQTWKANDDDDDIPEWHPDFPMPAIHGFQQPPMHHPPMVNQPLGPSYPHHLMQQQQQQQLGVPPVVTTMLNMPPVVTAMLNMPPGMWPQPQGFQPGNLGSWPNVGQPQGNWPSRGF